MQFKKNPTQNIQNSYSAIDVYEQNINGISDFNILKMLQQMAMVTNVYFCTAFDLEMTWQAHDDVESD